MSKSEDNIQYFRPELSYTLHYWAQTRAVSASAAATGLKTSSTVEFVKTKIIKVHPVLPLILSCDEEENITLWNYELKQKLMSQPVYSFINEQQRKTAVAATPQTKRYNQRSMDRHNDELLFQPKYVSYAPRKPIDQSAKYREVYGAVKDLDFADESTITYNGSNDATPQSAEYRIFIQFDQAVAFIHLMTKKVSLVTPQILNNKAPTAIDFLTPNSCMIGCSDGGVRIWNISQSKVEKSFSIGKTDVSILKVLPFESPVEEAADYQKIRVFSLGGDGNGLFWCFTLQNGVIITGTDNAIAKLNEPISQKVSAQSVLVDRENQQLIIRVTDHKFNVWDLQDLHSIATSLKDSKRMSSGRRGSLLTFKIGGGNANPADDGMPRINCHAVLKIEKTLQQSITKVYSFALMKHLAFLSGVYAVTPKNHMIMLVHSASGGGDDSEQASAITTANEKQRLNLLLEINLQRYVNDYYQKMSGGTSFNATDHLKIYSINTSILNPHLLILATSYGPMVLSLPQLPSGPFVAYHHSWKESLITNLENYAKRLSYDVHGHDHITNSTDGVNTFSSNTAFDLDVDVVSEFRYEKNVVGEAKTNLHDKKPAPNKGVVTVGSGSNPFKEEKPIFLPSPSGDYCTLFWPTLCCYSILHIPAASSSHGSMSISADDQGSPDHSHRSIPRDSSLRGKKNLVNSLIAGGATLQEVERGSCLEFAWISFDNSFVIKTPMGQKTVVASDKNRRGSLAGFFSKQEKVSKKMVFNELLLKRIVYTTSHDVQILQLTTVEIPNPDYDPEKAATVVNTHSNTAAAVPAAPISQTLSLDVKQVVDLFSGPLVSLNYQIPSEAKSKFITNPEEIPIIESKSSLGGVYHQFFYYNEDAHKLCPVGPVMQRVLSVKWDYLNGLVAVQTVDGTIHVLKLTTDEGKGNFQSTPLIKLQTIASIQSNSLHHIPNNPWNRYFWFDGLLWFQSSPQINAQDEITNPFTLYSFWKIPSIQTKSSAANKELAYYSYETYQWHISGKKSNDWKFISGIFHGDLVNICNGMIVFSCRDGSLKALRLSDYPLLSVFLFLHQYGAAIEIGGESDITHFLPSILRNYLHALTSDEKERLKQWLLNRDMKEQLLSFPSLSQSQVNLILSSQKTD